MDERRTVTIVGAGPAGMAAAIYLQRVGMAPSLLESRVPGGLLRTGYLIENYPGFPHGIEGERLALLMNEHLEAVGGGVITATVKNIRRTEGKSFLVISSLGDIVSKAVIVATGTKPTMVDIPGSNGLEGLRVFYDLYDLLEASQERERIIVYGGGDAAFDMAINLTRRGHEVIIQCRSPIRCLPLLRKRADHDGIQVREGNSIVGVKLRNERVLLEIKEEGPIEVDRLLIACGREPRLDILDPSILPPGQTLSPGTNVPGLFLAGDVVGGRERQVGIAIGSGMSAAMKAELFLAGI